MTCNEFPAVIKQALQPGEMPHLQVPRDFGTVQVAINLAPVGGKLDVTESEYHEKIMVEKVLQVDLIGVDGAQSTVINGGCIVAGGQADRITVTFTSSGSGETLSLYETLV